jgi:hypothetical protein
MNKLNNSEALTAYKHLYNCEQYIVNKQNSTVNVTIKIKNLTNFTAFNMIQRTSLPVGYILQRRVRLKEDGFSRIVFAPSLA